MRRSPSKRIYAINHSQAAVNIRLHNQALSAIDWPHIDAHSFNRLGSRHTVEQFEYFPYGITFRECIGAAPNNEFGFRIHHDVGALSKRGSHEKVIVVLGGSAAWSWFAFHEETFSYLLERRLQAMLTAAGRPETIYVLNFGQGGTVVLHEMIVYLLHCEKLRPDIVISHDGYNDLAWALTSDPNLLDRQICAPHIFESWAARLHGTESSEPRVKPGQELRPSNRPRPIIEAYLERKLQLARLAEAAGARHIFSVQPWILSKGKLSEIERDYVTEMRRSETYGKLYERMPYLYQALTDSLQKLPDISAVNLHSSFASFDKEETLFQDAMHTTPLGEKAIADCYFDHIDKHSLLG